MVISNMTSQLIQKAVSVIKKIPSTCGICKKKGVNTYGECECSYEDKGLIKRNDVIDALPQIITGVIEEIDKEWMKKISGMLPDHIDHKEFLGLLPSLKEYDRN